MNLQQFQYIIEVAKTQSISGAAENLCMNQPNLSRSIRELEHELGFTIFQRTAKGILLTREGEELVTHANKILSQVDTIRTIGKKEKVQRAFSISVPRSSYISTALARFIDALNPNRPVEIDYKETNSLQAIDNVLTKNYNMAIVRYQTTASTSFLSLFQEKDLRYEEIACFSYKVLMSEKHPLAEKNDLTLDDLTPHFELAYGDPYVASLNHVQAKQLEAISDTNKHIYVYERGSQFDILCDAPNVYMWASPMPEHVLKRYKLVYKNCRDVNRTYVDMLVYPVKYRLRKLDKAFLDELKKIRDQTFIVN